MGYVDKNGNRTGSDAGEAYAYDTKDQATTLTASVTLAGVAYVLPLIFATVVAVVLRRRRMLARGAARGAPGT